MPYNDPGPCSYRIMFISGPCNNAMHAIFLLVPCSMLLHDSDIGILF